MKTEHCSDQELAGAIARFLQPLPGDDGIVVVTVLAADGSRTTAVLAGGSAPVLVRSRKEHDALLAAALADVVPHALALLFPGQGDLVGSAMLYRLTPAAAGPAYPAGRALTVIAQLCGERILAAREQERLRGIANRDPKTGAYNARFLGDLFPQLKAQADRDNSPFSLVAADLNKFKALNARFGEVRADMLLKRVMQFVGERLRASDVLVRFGGDELVVVLPNTGRDGAATRAAALQEQLAAEDFAVPGIEGPADVARVSMAAGIATYGTDGDALPPLLHAAFARMREQKLGLAADSRAVGRPSCGLPGRASPDSSVCCRCSAA